jgi:hypothetical protein
MSSRVVVLHTGGSSETHDMRNHVRRFSLQSTRFAGLRSKDECYRIMAKNTYSKHLLVIIVNELMQGVMEGIAQTDIELSKEKTRSIKESLGRRLTTYLTLEYVDKIMRIYLTMFQNESVEELNRLARSSANLPVPISLRQEMRILVDLEREGRAFIVDRENIRLIFNIIRA